MTKKIQHRHPCRRHPLPEFPRRASPCPQSPPRLHRDGAQQPAPALRPRQPATQLRRAAHPRHHPHPHQPPGAPLPAAGGGEAGRGAVTAI